MDFINFFGRVLGAQAVASWVRIFLELIDFMLKATAAYRETPEGRKEWEDFAGRYEGQVNTDASNETVAYTVLSDSEEAAAPIKSVSKRLFSVEDK